MAFDFGGVADLVSAGGALYSAFQSPQKTPNNSAPFKGLIDTGAYRFGGGLLRGTNDFSLGEQGIRANLANLQQQVKPGFGALTEAGAAAIRQAGAQASGNLRAQLAQRGLQGASFAQDQLASVASEFSKQEHEFRTQAWQQELNATMSILDAQHQSLLSQATKDLSELSISTGFLDSVNQSLLSQKAIEQALAQRDLMNKYQNAATAPAAPASATVAPKATPRPPAVKPYKVVAGNR